jgi:hypothetical protein
MPEMVVVAKFRNRVEAEMAQTMLSDAGIESFIKADDAGGMVAGMDASSGGAKLLVSGEDAEESLEILEQAVDEDDLVDADEFEDFDEEEDT